MKLRDWLANAGVSRAEFAKSIDCSLSMLGKLCTGHRVPGPALARAIVQGTKGAVTFIDLFGGTSAPASDTDPKTEVISLARAKVAELEEILHRAG